MDAAYWNNLHLISREEASKVIEEHEVNCAFSKLAIEPRLRLQENRFFALIGFMVGGGFFGGVAGGALVKLLGG
jgi:hypothetical protein